MRDWHPGSSPSSLQVRGGCLATRAHQPTSQITETSGPAALQEPTHGSFSPPEDNLFTHEHTLAPVRWPASGHLTSDCSRNFISAGGKLPLSGCGPEAALL